MDNMLRIVRDGEGREVLRRPLGANVLAGATDTGGVVSFIIHSLEPRALGSPVHTHRNEDEWSFVLVGEVGVEVGERTWTARPGDLVLKPRGVPHAFWNSTDQPARFLEVITPSGFEGYFEQLARVFSTAGPPDTEALKAVREQYSLDVDLTSVARLSEVYGLRARR